MSKSGGAYSLQVRVNGLNSMTTLAELNSILLELARHREVRAAVYVYDYLKKTRGFTPNDSTKRAMLSLHYKNLVPSANIQVPASKRRVLQPKRRVHKICKAWIKQDGLKKAKHKLNEVSTWVKQNRSLVEKIKAKKRIQLADLIAKHTSATRGEARLLITNMKQRKILATTGGQFCVL